MYKFLILAFLFPAVAVSQQAKKMLLLNAKLHVGNGDVIEKAAVAIENGRILFVRNALSYTVKAADFDTIIDFTGQEMYPGFVAPNSSLGLTEIDAVRATNDFHEVGIFNPHVRSLIAFNVESNILATVRTNGVLMAQACPRGGTIAGTSSVMQLAGWNWEDAVAQKDDGIHLNWPSTDKVKQLDAKEAENQSKENYAAQKSQIEAFFEMAMSYSGKKEKDIRLEAMQALFSGEKRLYIHANSVQQLLDILDFVKQFELKFPVIVGGEDAYLIADRMRDAKIPVMLPRLHRLPESEDDPIDLPFRLPAMFQAAGIAFCLQNEGDMEAMQTRNLPFLAGTAMAYGLTEEQAIRSISLSACEIMGMDKNYGSVEAGKVANLFVSKGNALDMKSNQLSFVLINGKSISLNNRQVDLYQKYKSKYENSEVTR